MEIHFKDMEDNIIQKITTDEIFKPNLSVKPVKEISINKEYEFYEKLDQNIIVFSPSKVEDDFIIDYMSKKYFDYLNIDYNKILGRYLSEVFPIYNNLKIFKFLNKVDKSGEKFKFREFRYVESILISIYTHELFYLDGHIYHIGFYEEDSLILGSIFKDLFYSVEKPGLIFQDNQIVEVNNSFLEYFKTNPKEIIGDFDIKSLNLVNLDYDEFNLIIDSLLNREIFFEFFEFSIVNSKGDKIWLKAYMYPSVYNDTNSINAYLEDITQYKYDEIKSTYLKESLPIVRDIQNISFFRQYKDNKILFSKEIYSILEEDSNKDIDINNYLKSSDKEILEKKIKHLSYEYNVIKTYFTVKTAKGNEKHIKLMLEANFNDNNEIISFVGLVKDVTYDFSEENRLNDNLLTLTHSLDEIKNTFLNLK